MTLREARSGGLDGSNGEAADPSPIASSCAYIQYQICGALADRATDRPEAAHLARFRGCWRTSLRRTQNSRLPPPATESARHERRLSTYSLVSRLRARFLSEPGCQRASASVSKPIGGPSFRPFSGGSPGEPARPRRLEPPRRRVMYQPGAS